MRFFVLGSYMNANFMQLARLPVEGESLQAHGVWQEHGGKGLNLGVGLHRLGMPVKMLLGVGNDDAGKAVHEVLEREGMDTSAVLCLDAHSGYGVGFVGPQGENFLAAYQGANARVGAQHVQQHFVDMTDSDWVCAQFEAPEEAILAAFELAQRTRARTYLNPSPWRMPSREILALTDVLVVNETEAAAMFSMTNAASWDAHTWKQQLPSMAQQLALSCELILVTLGAEGVVAYTNKGETHFHPAWSIMQVDATGAGDAFGCGLLWGWSQRLPLDQVLPFANACGALVAAAQGVLAALPNTARVESFCVENSIN
jgi:ribokinase